MLMRGKGRSTGKSNKSSVAIENKENNFKTISSLNLYETLLPVYSFSVLNIQARIFAYYSLNFSLLSDNIAYILDMVLKVGHKPDQPSEMMFVRM